MSNIADDAARREFVLDNYIPRPGSLPADQLVSRLWLDSLRADAAVGPLQRGLGAAGAPCAKYVYDAIVQWYGVDDSHVAVRVAQVGSDAKIPTRVFGLEQPLAELGNDVRASAIYGSYISAPVIRQSRVVSAKTIGELDLGNNESLIVSEKSAMEHESPPNTATSGSEIVIDLREPDDMVVDLTTPPASLPSSRPGSPVQRPAVSDPPQVPAILASAQALASPQASPEPPAPPESPPVPASPPGRRGLSNMGNTCFMNSSLQALLHVPELIAYFGSGEYVRDLNRSNPIGCQGLVADAFARLVRAIYGRREGSGMYYSNAVRPYDFLATIGRFNRAFASRRQQDSQEFTAFLLDSLHEDLNRIVNKPATEKPELEGAPTPEKIAELARRSWDTHKLRNDSPITDLFTGLYKSTLVCPQCDKVSITFDPFFDLTLPLPRTQTWLKDVVFVPMQGPALSTQVALTPNSTIADLCRQVCELVGSASSGVLGDVFDRKFYRLFTDRQIVSADIGATDEVAVYEMPSQNEEGVPGTALENAKPVPVYLRQDGAATGYPFFVFLNALDEIESKVAEKVRELLGAECEMQFSVYPGSTDELVYGWGGTRLRPLSAVVRNEPISVEPISVEPLSDGHIPVDPTSVDPSSVDPTSDGPTSDEPTKPNRNPAVKDLAEEPFEVVFSSPSSLSSSNSSESLVPLSMNLSEDFVLVVDVNEPLDLVISTTVTNPAAQRASAERSKKRVFTLEDSLRQFEQPEVLGDEDLWYCPQCREFRHAKKQLELWKVPDVLMIHLKRFSGAHSMAQKIDDLVTFPLEDLDLAPFLSGHEDAVYDLFAVDNHFGGMGGGHYTAYVREPFSEEWLDFNDSYVSPISADSVVTPAAYLLFYRRRGTEMSVDKARDAIEGLRKREAAVAASDDTEMRDVVDDDMPGGPDF